MKRVLQFAVPQILKMQLYAFGFLVLMLCIMSLQNEGKTGLLFGAMLGGSMMEVLVIHWTLSPILITETLRMGCTRRSVIGAQMLWGMVSIGASALIYIPLWLQPLRRLNVQQADGILKTEVLAKLMPLFVGLCMLLGVIGQVLCLLTLKFGVKITVTGFIVAFLSGLGGAVATVVIPSLNEQVNRHLMTLILRWSEATVWGIWLWVAAGAAGLCLIWYAVSWLLLRRFSV